ncbi:apolipoprotein C-I-like [Rana temporaria]|uniref:apolipoprotein C-I-like n=1 Tax=Rana temporaria TaxID=8407 RepID=UPI001AACE7EF|nr:apolipoprotein C-I-like [Rana temporaria]
MKLILAISVVIIALTVLAGPSSAESEESPVKEKFDSIVTSIKGAANKAQGHLKSAYERARDSEFGTKTRDFFSDLGKKIKDKFSKK